MFDFEQAITEWRQQMIAAGIKTPVPLEELENHLREEIERQMKSGLNEQEAFNFAIQKIGRPYLLKSEFKKAGGIGTFTKPHRVLGILWLIFCGYFGITMLWRMRHEFSHYPNIRLIEYVGDLICLMYLAGIVASIFLLRGATWARIVIGVVALVTSSVFIALLVFAHSSTVPGSVVGVLALFAFTSGILLLFPRRHAAAS